MKRKRSMKDDLVVDFEKERKRIKKHNEIQLKNSLFSNDEFEEKLVMEGDDVCMITEIPGDVFFSRGEVQEKSESEISKKDEKQKKKSNVKKGRKESSVKNAGNKHQIKENAAPNIVSPPPPISVDSVVESNWKHLGVHPHVISKVCNLSFTEPTPIQEKAIPEIIRNRDPLIAVSETGSGKTLVFIVPIITNILNTITRNSQILKHPLSLIMAPTRELCLQICRMFAPFLENTPLRQVSLVGKMSLQKQSRILDKVRPEIIVGTPDRISKLMVSHPYLCFENWEHLRFFVIDEADRIVRKHGAQSHLLQGFENVVGFLSGSGSGKEKEKHDVYRTARNAGNNNNNNNNRKNHLKNAQKIFTSATITLPQQFREGDHNFLQWRKYFDPETHSNSDFLTMISKLLGIDGVRVFDLSRPSILPEGVHATMIRCLNNLKFHFLYYLARRYGGKKIVFCNSINAVKQVERFFHILGVSCMSIHGAMRRGQRLKKMDQFRGTNQGNSSVVLVATDVFSRGMDIENVEIVIHFQLPRSSEVYIHRVGRTGRASREGMSIALVDENDSLNYQYICRATSSDGEGGYRDLPLFPVDQFSFNDIRKRVDVSKSIMKLEKKKDSLLVSQRKKNKDKNEGMFVEREDMNNNNNNNNNQKKKKKKRKKRSNILDDLVTSDNLLDDEDEDEDDEEEMILLEGTNQQLSRCNEEIRRLKIVLKNESNEKVGSLNRLVDKGFVTFGDLELYNKHSKNKFDAKQDYLESME